MNRHVSRILGLALLWLLAGCGSKDGTAPVAAEKIPGMTAYPYLASDGGPHLVLPKELSRQWTAVTLANMYSPLDPKTDYGRACAATETKRMALIPVGSGRAIVLAQPPMSAWGRSPEGWIDIYDLEGWSDLNLDGLIQRAVAAIPTKAMTDRGDEITLKESDLILLFAGDAPGNVAYDELAIPIDPGTYRILEGTYKPEKELVDEVSIYRLQPKKR